MAAVSWNAVRGTNADATQKSLGHVTLAGAVLLAVLASGLARGVKLARWTTVALGLFILLLAVGMAVNGIKFGGVPQESWAQNQIHVGKQISVVGIVFLTVWLPIYRAWFGGPTDIRASIIRNWKAFVVFGYVCMVGELAYLASLRMWRTMAWIVALSFSSTIAGIVRTRRR